MSQSLAERYDSAIQRYQEGGSVADILAEFQLICRESPKMSSAWTCLAWLYLLDNKADRALKAAQKAVKLEPNDPQARVNLAIAMLETKTKGVRDQVDIIKQMADVEEVREQLDINFKDGLARQPNWSSLQRLQAWIDE
jgi:predicted Zn-dependent protease